jgi:hypothetical protein
MHKKFSVQLYLTASLNNITIYEHFNINKRTLVNCFQLLRLSITLLFESKLLLN